MSNRLKRLKIQGLRGATGESSLEFAPNKKITMIFGENGTGKSTLVDAFSFLCESSAGSVLERSGGTIDHAVSLGTKKEDVRVELETDSATWTAKFDGRAPRVSPPVGFPTLRVLRRSSILRLVEAQPAERFEALRSFLALSGIETSETSLRDARRTTEGSLQTAILSLADATDALEEYWKKEGSPDECAIKWAKKAKESDQSELNDEKAKIAKIRSPLEVLNQEYARIAPSEARKQETKFADEKARDRLQREAEKISGQSSELLTILQNAQNFIKGSKQLTDCPVCEQTVDQASLIESLGKRISAMSALKQAATAAAHTKRTRTSAEDAHTELIKSVASSATHACSAFSAHSLDCLSDIEIDSTVFEAPDEENPAATVTRVQPLVDQIEAILRLLDERAEEIRTSTAKRNAITTLLEKIDQNRKRQEELNRILTGLSTALTIVEAKRKDFVRDVLNEISMEVDRLYLKIHPNESMGKLTLKLRDGMRGSLLLLGDFYSKTQIPPQAYFSESHLDTLGLCIFLALAKKYDTEIVILDDVVTSVDSSHLDRIIELIDEESDHFAHIIVTTHYRPWRDQYRYHSTANSKLSFVELRFWSMENGIHVHTNKLAIEELEFSLKPENFDRQISAQRAGIILESVLNTLSIRYGTKVPNKRPPDYTLGELLSSLSKLSKLLRIERFDVKGNLIEEIPMKEKYEAVFRLVWIRNKVGAHFNFDGQEISDAQVIQFGTATLDLVKALVCPSSGSIPHKNNGTCWESQRGLTRLHPLVQP